MNAEIWQENNTRYLSIALDWLRLRLLRRAKPVVIPVSSATPIVESTSVSFMEQFLRKDPAPAIPALPPPTNMEEQIAQLEKEMSSFEDTTPLRLSLH